MSMLTARVMKNDDTVVSKGMSDPGIEKYAVTSVKGEII
jgi:hypothetical protein